MQLMWVELVSKMLLGHYEGVLGILVFYCEVARVFWEIMKVLLGCY